MTQMQKIALAICEAVGNDDMMRDIKERIQNDDPIETLTYEVTHSRPRATLETP